jgi:hypothetical protein
LAVDSVVSSLPWPGRLLEGHSDAQYGERTRLAHAVHRFAMFTRAQAQAIAAYLRFRCEVEPEGTPPMIEQALNNYWLRRAEARPVNP